MKKILLWVWQAPQNIAGLVFYEICKRRSQVHSAVRLDGKIIVWVYMNIGVSLGNYVFINRSNTMLDNTTKHELGHCKQSILLGPLYLLIVGIPSAFFNNLWDRAFHKSWSSLERHKWYYARFPEAWADRLGKVERV